MRLVCADKRSCTKHVHLARGISVSCVSLVLGSAHALEGRPGLLIPSGHDWTLLLLLLLFAGRPASVPACLPHAHRDMFLFVP